MEQFPTRTARLDPNNNRFATAQLSAGGVPPLRGPPQHSSLSQRIPGGSSQVSALRQTAIQPSANNP